MAVYMISKMEFETSVPQHAKIPSNGLLSTAKGGRVKKKSALAKLAEKKKQSLVTDGNSQFGSQASISKDEIPDSSNTDCESKDKPDASRPADHGAQTQAIAGQSSGKSDHSGNVFSSSSTAVGENTVKRTPPRPAPRARKASAEKLKKLSPPGAEEVVSESSPAGAEKAKELSPPPPRMVEYESNSDDDKDGDAVSKKAPSDATLHRFRALRMATERTDSVESLKNLPFVPKPPLTPKSARRISPPKGEKRIRDPYSSSEEPEVEAKKSSRLSLDLPLGHNSDKDNPVENNKDTVSLRSEPVDADRDSLTSRNPLYQESELQTQKNFSEILQSKAEYHEKMSSDIDHLSEHDPAFEEAPGPSNYMYNTADSMLINNSAGSPRPNKLEPISPKHHPPPFPTDFASQSLRTAYKADPAYTLNKFLSKSMSAGSEHKNASDNMSQGSYASTGVMPSITIKEARARSYLIGGENASLALLGSEELDRYFPDRRVRVWIGSWNMGEMKDCKTSMDDFILPEASEIVQDIYAVGTQENNMHKKDWEIVVQETIGPSHVLFHSVSHGSLHLSLFIRRDLIWFCSVPEDGQVTTRAVTMVKTKGAVALSFSFFGTSFLFVNCHFTSDDSNRKKRMKDYQKIITGLNLPKSTSHGQSPSSSNQDCTAKFDCVFWCGDLNFRIDKHRTCVEDLVHYIVTSEYPNFEDLLTGDQLTKCIVEGTIFQGFQEGRINFKPSYKFDVNSDKYDTSTKNRIPSYTDRILFRAKKKNSINCIHYDSVMSVKSSDHRPVYALFDATLKPGRDNVPLAAGQFDRVVYMEANRRRAMHRASVQRNQKASTVCTIQ